MFKVENYIPLAKRTESLVLGLNDLPLRLLHSAIGLGTEIIECNLNYSSITKTKDSINILEEIGDCFWYIAIGCDVLDIKFEDYVWFVENNDTLYDGDTKLHLEFAEQIIGNILDTVKRHIFYRKAFDINDLRKDYICLITQLCLAIISTGNNKIEDVLKYNIEKLKKRFPDKYTDYDAIVRDLDSERKILENLNITSCDKD